MLFVLLVTACVPLRAQAPGPDYVRTWPVDSVLARFEQETRRGAAWESGSRGVCQILALSAPFRARRDSLLDALERLAMTSDHRQVWSAAAARIACAGQPDQGPPAATGIIARLTRMYHRTQDVGVRSNIMDRLPEQAERLDAAALLRSIAAQPDPHLHRRMDDIGDVRTEALRLLAMMGGEGQAVLRAMHRSGEARSPHARALLAEMARRGFPVRDLARERQARP